MIDYIKKEDVSVHPRDLIKPFKCRIFHLLLCPKMKKINTMINVFLCAWVGPLMQPNVLLNDSKTGQPALHNTWLLCNHPNHSDAVDLMHNGRCGMIMVVPVVLTGQGRLKWLGVGVLHLLSDRSQSKRRFMPTISTRGYISTVWLLPAVESVEVNSHPLWCHPSVQFEARRVWSHSQWWIYNLWKKCLPEHDSQVPQEDQVSLRGLFPCGWERCWVLDLLESPTAAC